MTAVEWLEMQLGSKIADANIRISAPKFFELINQAKEMEKQHIIESYRNGRCDQQSARKSNFYNRMAEQYYNEKFKMK